jgi:hypothetical protein
MAPDVGQATAILNAIPPGECLTMDALVEVSGRTRRQVSNSAAKLVERDLVERIDRGCFRLTEAGVRAQADGMEIKSGPRGPMTRRQPARNSLRKRLWRAMRLKKKFTINSLLIDAARDEKSPVSAAGYFVRALERAGYLMRMPRREQGTSPTSNGYLRWSLLRDTGPLTPLLRSDGTVFDPNTGETLRPGLLGEVVL